MSKPIIRFIVTTFASTGQDGSRYHFAQVRSTISGRVLFVQNAGNNCVANKVETVAAVDGLTVYTVQVEMGRLEWKRANPTAAIHGHQLTREMIDELEIVKELQI